MVIEDNTRMARKAIKNISVGECFKLSDEPFTLYLRIDSAEIPGLNDDYIPCVKMMRGTLDILNANILVYPVKSKLIISKEDNVI